MFGRSQAKSVRNMEYKFQNLEIICYVTYSREKNHDFYKNQNQESIFFS